MRVQVNCRQGLEEEAVDVAEAWAWASQCLYWYQRPFRRWLFATPPGIVVNVAELQGREADDLQVRIT